MDFQNRSRQRVCSGGFVEVSPEGHCAANLPHPSQPLARRLLKVPLVKMDGTLSIALCGTSLTVVATKYLPSAQILDSSGIVMAWKRG